ncbi:MAG: peptidase S8, partial [Desulfobacterales bacterium]|nr:peptidase S8 [Desulfobacterales bacterium]
ISANPDLTNTQVVEIITQNADDLGDPGFDSYYGYGRINAYSSLVAAIGTTPEFGPEPEPDITDPWVSIVSPVEGSTVSGSVRVSVSATDNVGIERVELYIDGTFFGTSTTASYDFYWDTNDLLEGGYELSAIAYDSSDNLKQSNSVTVYVSNSKDTTIGTIAPSVNIGSPEDGVTVSGLLVKISASATSDVGVNRMELYIDEILKAVKYRSTLNYNWNMRKESVGEHEIEIMAYDTAGKVGIEQITVYK